MIAKGSLVQLNNDHRTPLDQGAIVFTAGAVGEVETPGERWARVRFTETVSAIVPARLLNEVSAPTLG